MKARSRRSVGQQALLRAPRPGSGAAASFGGQLEVQVAAAAVLGGPVDGQVGVERVHAVLAARARTAPSTGRRSWWRRRGRGTRARAPRAGRPRAGRRRRSAPSPTGRRSASPPAGRRPRRARRRDRQVTHLAWLGGSCAKWIPRSVPAAGDRAVGLGQPQRVAGRLGEAVLAEPLQEHAAVVAVLHRRHLEGTGHRQLTDLHGPAGYRRRLPLVRLSSPMTWLVVGSLGMLGTDVREVLDAHGIAHTDCDKGDIDLFDPDGRRPRSSPATTWSSTAPPGPRSTRPRSRRPAAFTPQRRRARPTSPARRAATAPGCCRSAPTTSSTATPPTPYAEDHPLAPRSAYGRTKAAGEWAVRAEAPQHALVVRTAWLYGAHGPLLPQDDRQGRPRARGAAGGRRPGRPADLDPRRGRADGPPRRAPRPPAGHLARHLRSARRRGSSSRGRSWRPPGSRRRSSARPTPRPSSGRRRARPTACWATSACSTPGIAPIGDWRERWAVAGGSVLAVDQVD